MKRLPIMLCLAAILVAACPSADRPIAPPPSGTSLTLTLMSPAADDGAILLEVRGPAMKAVTPADSTWHFFSELVGDTLFRAVIVGPIGPTDLMTIEIGSGASESAYRATIIEVADQLGELRANLQSYDLRIVGN